MRWQEAWRNVAVLVDRLRVTRREAGRLPPADAQRLLDAARGDRLYALYAVATACGLRRGEALALRWVDVDLDTGTPHRADAVPDRRGLTFIEPESTRSRRTVPLPATCVAELRAFHAVAARAGLVGVSLHTLRHTCASLLLAQGMHPRPVMETLGHSGNAMTMDVYSHVMPQQQRKAADRMDAALRW